MAFFSKNLYYIKFFSEMYYNVFSTKADQEGGSIHEKKNLFPEIHILDQRSLTSMKFRCSLMYVLFEYSTLFAPCKKCNPYCVL